MSLLPHDSIVKAGSVGQVERALAKAEHVVVVVDLSIGGASPERVVALCRAHPSALVLACRRGPLRTSDPRARKLGIDEVHSFPDGVLARVLDLCAAAPSFTLRRTAERARINGEAHGDLDGQLINISEGGALVEAASAVGDGELSVSLGVPGIDAPVVVRARVCWQEHTNGDRARLGLEFVAVSNETRRGIAEYVRQTNAVRVSRAAEPRRSSTSVRVSKEGASRQDWFRLERDGDDVLLIPKKQFFVPWQPGDTLRVRVTGQAERKMRVTERLLLDPDRVDGRVGWRVKPGD
jgi:hypothetical protein